MEKNEKFTVDRTPISISGTVYMPIPPDIVKYLEVEFDEKGKPKTPMKIMPDIGRWGKFVGLWNPKQQSK